MEIQASYDNLSKDHQATKESLTMIKSNNEGLIKTSDELQSKIREMGVENGKLEVMRANAVQALKEAKEQSTEALKAQALVQAP